MHSRIFVTAAVFISLTMAAFADDKVFPVDGGQKFVVTIPDRWESEVDSDNVLCASSPDEEVSLAAWAADDKEMADFKSPGITIAHILRDCVKGIRLKGEPKKSLVGKSQAWVFEGSGTDVDDNVPVQFMAMILISSPTDATVVCVEADSKAKAGRIAGMANILATIRPQ